MQSDGFFIIKQADGELRWFGFPTNNAKDRDREIIPAALLEECIQQQKAQNDYPPLRFHHIAWDAGTTDYMNFTEGIAYATGLINHDPISQKMAQFAMDHPGGPDGSGWAMSHGFMGIHGPDGIYRTLSRIKEFTFLSWARAANPYTSWRIEESEKMLTQEQRNLLDKVLGEPEMVQTVMMHVQAQQKSQDMDAAGVQRKSLTPFEAFGFADQSTEKYTQYNHGSGGMLNAPGAGSQGGPVAGPTGGMNPSGSGGGNGSTQIGPCIYCGHSAADHTTLGEKAMNRGACKVAGCKCKGYGAKDDSGGSVDDNMTMAGKMPIARKGRKDDEEADDDSDESAARKRRKDDGDNDADDQPSSSSRKRKKADDTGASPTGDSQAGAKGRKRSKDDEEADDDSDDQAASRKRRKDDEEADDDSDETAARRKRKGRKDDEEADDDDDQSASRKRRKGKKDDDEEADDDSDDQSMGRKDAEIAAAIHKMGENVQKAINPLLEKMLDRIEGLESRIKSFEQDEAHLKSQHEMPRLSLMDRLDKLQASRSGDTVLDGRTKMAKEVPNINQLEKDADGLPDIARAFGFGGNE